MPTLDGIIRALKALIESGIVIAAILLVGQIIYQLEEKWKK